MDEAELIRQAKAGSAEAFAGLVRLHQGRVRAFVSRYVHDDDMADDLAQEAFIQAYRALPSYQPEGSLAAWLLVIARNQALGHLRAESRRRAREAGALDQALSRWRAERLETGAEDPRLTVLDECLERLPPHAAALVEQHYFRGRPATELARESGRGNSGIRMTLLRIRQALRRCLAERLALEGS